MSEQTGSTTAAEETNSQAKENGGADTAKPEVKAEFTAITSQEDFDKAIQARIARERAKFSDYDEVKARADKLAEIEESQKTEAQKQAEQLAASQRRVAELEAANLRAEVAAEKGVPAALISGATREELETAADALIEFKGKQPEKEPEKKGALGPIIREEGKTPQGNLGGPKQAFTDAMSSVFN